MGFNGNSKIDNTLPINVVLFYILSRKFQQGGSLDEHTLKTTNNSLGPDYDTNDENGIYIQISTSPTYMILGH